MHENHNIQRGGSNLVESGIFFVFPVFDRWKLGFCVFDIFLDFKGFLGISKRKRF